MLELRVGEIAGTGVVGDGADEEVRATVEDDSEVETGRVIEEDVDNSVDAGVELEAEEGLEAVEAIDEIEVEDEAGMTTAVKVDTDVDGADEAVAAEGVETTAVERVGIAESELEEAAAGTSELDELGSAVTLVEDTEIMLETCGSPVSVITVVSEEDDEDDGRREAGAVVDAKLAVSVDTASMVAVESLAVLEIDGEATVVEIVTAAGGGAAVLEDRLVVVDLSLPCWWHIF